MFSISEVAKSGKETYAILEAALTLKYPGKYAAIEPISKEYFIGTTIGEAISNASAKFPHREFYTVKVGEPAAISFMR